MYCRTLSCWSQWQRLQSGVRGENLSRESNYATAIFVRICRYKCGQPTSAVSKHSLPRLLNSLLTIAIVSELLTVPSNYKEVDKFLGFPKYATAFWGVTPCCPWVGTKVSKNGVPPPQDKRRWNKRSPNKPLPLSTKIHGVTFYKLLMLKRSYNHK
jgi:hypothetical protein